MFKRITMLYAALSITIAIATPTPAHSQGNSTFGITASIGMPSGLVPAAGIPTAANTLSITYGMTTSILMLINEQLQIEAGIGYVSVSTSYDKESIKEPDPLSAISFSAGCRYFLRKAEVQPYVGGGFSYTSLPSVTGFDMKEISVNLFSFIGFVGAQGFINKSQTVALFIQIGFGFNTFTGGIPDPDTFQISKGTFSTINFGGSAIGGTIYL